MLSLFSVVCSLFEFIFFSNICVEADSQFFFFVRHCFVAGRKTSTENNVPESMVIFVDYLVSLGSRGAGDGNEHELQNYHAQSDIKRKR